MGSQEGHLEVGTVSRDKGLGSNAENNEPMMDKNWSWCYEEKEKFPEMTGDPRYADNNTRCVSPVKLEPDKEYVIWINTANFKNFKDKTGNPAEPYEFTFKTR